MGKGTIQQHIEEGKYLVQMNYNIDRFNDWITDLEDKISNEEDNISSWDVDIAAKQAEVDALPVGPEKEKAINELAVLNGRKKHAQLRKTSYEKRKEFLENNVPEDFEQFAWCADYTLDLEGEVGTIEIAGEVDKGVNIQPGYDSNAPFDMDRDGQIHPAIAETPYGTFVNMALLPGWQKWKPTFRYGQIKALSENTAQIVELESVYSRHQNLDVNQANILYDVPIEYMTCGGEAFVVGDSVIVEFENQDFDNPKVIGFKEEPKPCPKEFFVYGLSKNNARSTTYCIVYDLQNNDFANIFYEYGRPLTRAELDQWVADTNREELSYSQMWTSADEGENKYHPSEIVFETPDEMDEHVPLEFNLEETKENEFSYGGPFTDIYQYNYDRDYEGTCLNAESEEVYAGRTYTSEKIFHQHAVRNDWIGESDMRLSPYDIDPLNEGILSVIYKHFVSFDSKVLIGVVGTAAEGEQSQKRYEYKRTTLTDQECVEFSCHHEGTIYFYWEHDELNIDTIYTERYKIHSPLDSTDWLDLYDYSIHAHYLEDRVPATDYSNLEYTEHRGYYHDSLHVYTEKSAIQLFIHRLQKRLFSAPDGSGKLGYYQFGPNWVPNVSIGDCSWEYEIDMVVHAALDFRLAGEADQHFNPNNQTRNTTLEGAIEILFSWYEANHLDYWEDPDGNEQLRMMSNYDDFYFKQNRGIYTTPFVRFYK